VNSNLRPLEGAREARHRPSWLIPALLCVFVISACAKPEFVPFVPPGTPLADEDPHVTQLLEEHRTEALARSAVRGSARVAIKGPDFKLNRPQRIVLAQPDRLRFEILGLFDQLAAVLVADGRRYGFYDASTGQVSRGRVSSDLLWTLTKIDLTAPEIVSMLLGAPLPEAGLRRAGAWRTDEGEISLAFAWPSGGDDQACAGEDPWGVLFAPACFLPERTLSDTGGQLFRFSADGRLAEIRALDQGGALRYSARFEDYTEVAAAVISDPSEAAERKSGVIFPKRVTLSSPGTGSEARFLWKRVMFADDLSDSLFRIPEIETRSGPPGRPGQPAPVD